MAQGNALHALVEQFVSQLQSQITRQVEAEFAGKIDAFKASLLGRGPSFAAPARAQVIRVPSLQPARRGPPAGYKAEQKPCPICKKLNTARRFSYLCENHRTDENRKKFKGKAGAAPAAAAPAAKKGPGRPPGKRGPGRPKGSKNKPKTAAPA